MHKNRKLTDEQEIKILEDYNSNVLTKKEIAKKHNTTKYIVTHALKRLGITNIKSDPLNEYLKDNTIFQDLTTQEQAYFIGVLMADGSIFCKKKNYNKPEGIVLSMTDKDVIEKFHKFCNTTIPIKKYYPPRKINATRDPLPSYRVCIGSQKIAKDLGKYGVIPNKTNRLLMNNIPDNLIPHLIRGYFDGDGCLHIRKNRNALNLQLTSSAKLFLEQVQQYLINKKLIRNKNYIINYKTWFTLNFDHRIEIINILNHIYNNAMVYMERKYQKYLSIKNKETFIHAARQSNKKYHNVFLDKRNGRFITYFRLHKKKYWIGCFSTELDAAIAYNTKITELGLPESMLNRIED